MPKIDGTCKNLSPPSYSRAATPRPHMKDTNNEKVQTSFWMSLGPFQPSALAHPHMRKTINDPTKKTMKNSKTSRGSGVSPASVV